MEKQKRWQFYLIATVIVLTLINILPTVFFYTQPLKEPIRQDRAESIAIEIAERVNSLEQESKDWLLSFCKLLKIQPVAIDLKADHPGLFEITFRTPNDAVLFRRFLPKAGQLIPFVPAQLSLYPAQEQTNQKTVLVARQINIHLDPAESNKYFRFYSKASNGELTPEFRTSIYERAAQLATGFGGPNRTAQQILAVVNHSGDTRFNDLALAIAKEIVEVDESLPQASAIKKRYLSSLGQMHAADKENVLQKFLATLSSLKSDLEKQKKLAVDSKTKEKSEKSSPDFSAEQQIAQLDVQLQALNKASQILQANKSTILGSPAPLTKQTALERLEETGRQNDSFVQTFDLEGRNPFIQSLNIEWMNDKIVIQLYPDVEALRDSTGGSEEEARTRDRISQLLINDIARVSRTADESIGPEGTAFAVSTTHLTNAQSFLALDLGLVAKTFSLQLLDSLLTSWQPEHADLVRESYPIVGFDSLDALSSPAQKLGLVIYAPAMFQDEPPEGFRATSIYVVARGLDSIIQKYKEAPNAPGAQELAQDVEQLSKLLQAKGFISYSGASYGIDKEFSRDTIFELDDYYTTLLNATRENFQVKGSKRNAVLDFTNVEQRILTWNTIQDRIHEDLLKWKDEYATAQADIDLTKRYEIPAPTKNAYWENFKLSLAKFFHGDDRKILKWGLDLSGGKTVRIGLRDENNRPVTNPEDLNQAVNELYTRINKMGVAERTVRIENNNIILDFPGSQALSASDLVKASAMYFHIVNEKFSVNNSNLREAISSFLQGVWNEAVVTNRKDLASINQIAWEHLGAERSGESTQPRSEAAQILYDNGLRLAAPDQPKSSALDDSLSSIAILKGEDFSEWEGQTNPLLIVFHNYALEGASLTNIQIGYDPTEGNTLSFGIKGSYEKSQKSSASPRDDFYAWTSQFSEDKIAGTPKEAYSQGRGWRMAVILNDTIITKPTLRAALRDAATISGRFTQREINQLAADLKAGSLSFTPKILSEQNISPELGKEERYKGISASILGLIFVAGTMIGYYRFGGFVATCAVLFNLLIMWAVLQNLGAALTLPGIAGIVLTIGMAVDANVLVFERVREEFKISGRIASAIQAGYRKAFTAIFDSNITTIIAALILIQFDSGPIKGFAVTLIIGLISSMFTSLFMTRYFFAGWVQNPKNKSLNMAELVGNTKIDFLSYTKPAVILSLAIMVGGGFLFYLQRNTMFGMDFTGGYSINLEVQEAPGNVNYRLAAADALMKAGAGQTEIDVRELSKSNHLRIQLSLGMEQEGHPFFQLPISTSSAEAAFKYENDPRIAWVVDALEKGGLTFSKSELENMDQHWSMMSGQFSNAMRNNALIALGCALISILIYITIRFEFKYATSAVLATAHDVLITMALLAIFKAIGFPIQIDLEVVGALMTLIGYSLNDTIIVFDRIREDLKLLRKLKFTDIINHAINITLSRTLMTSTTTLLALIPLLLFGGRSIFDFSLVMTIGVIVGTFSSLFIASPLLLYFHNREEAQAETAYKKA